jgi:serine/threonine protein kinase
MAFTLKEKISESATTCVYRAHDDTLGRDVLLKVLHRHLAHDEQVRQRFIREARACAALRSENIAQVFDLREHDGSPAIVMEYVAGQSLKDVIATGNQRTFAFTEKVAVHVLRGLAAAHAQGIIHRDIKPGNILVSTNGTVKITDFGLAQVAIAPTLTTEGMIVGTPAYFAPEVIRGESADARTDLFSLGATLVETLTGKRLFEGATYSECLNKISLFKLEQLDSLTTFSSPEFVAFLKKLMHPNPGQRYGSPKEALAALGKLSSSEFARPKISRAAPPTRRWVRIAAGAFTVVVLAGVYLFVSRPTVNQESAADSSSVATQLSALNSVQSGGGQPADSMNQAPSSTTTSPARQLPDTRNNAGVPSRDSGSVILHSSHNARVRVDSVLIGDLPFQQPVRLAAGPHTILFTHPSFEPILRTVSIAAGEEISVTADFLEKAGYLQCMAVPWAEISVDDQFRDTTPLDRPIILTAGMHRVRFHHPAFRDSVWEVSVAPKETVMISMTFKR